MGGCAFGLRSQLSAEPGNEQATDTLPCASAAMVSSGPGLPAIERKIQNADDHCRCR